MHLDFATEQIRMKFLDPPLNSLPEFPQSVKEELVTKIGIYVNTVQDTMPRTFHKYFKSIKIPSKMVLLWFCN